MNAQIRWYHDGAPHRAIVLPEPHRSPPARTAGQEPPAVQFETQVDGRWEAYDPDPASESFASAAAAGDTNQWRELLSLLPSSFRRFLTFFLYERLEALAVLTRCPRLLPELEAVPALTVFLAAHVRLRGSEGPRWNEIGAAYDNGGIFGLLEWLGLPACRQTLSILARIDDPELPRSLVAPLRAALWEPETLCELDHADCIREKDLARFRAPLAA
ncbi:MAG: hypothetical protein ACREFX_02930 [Opitutaceae bacterium]